MNTFEIIILALALVFTSWSSYVYAGGLFFDKALQTKVNYTGIMFLIQFLMTGAGIWIGFKFGNAESKINVLISLSIFFVTGLKVLLDNIGNQAADNNIEEESWKGISLLAVLEGIIPLVTGIAIGLLSLHPWLHWILLGVFFLSGILSGLFISGRKKPGKPLLRLGSAGGLLLLAAGIKLALNITGF